MTMGEGSCWGFYSYGVDILLSKVFFHFLKTIIASNFKAFFCFSIDTVYYFICHIIPLSVKANTGLLKYNNLNKNHHKTNEDDIDTYSVYSVYRK